LPSPGRFTGNHLEIGCTDGVDHYIARIAHAKGRGGFRRLTSLILRAKRRVKQRILKVDARFRVTEAAERGGEPEWNLRRQFEPAFGHADLLEALLGARRDLGQQRRKGARAFGTHACLCLLAIDQAHIEIQAALNGLSQCQFDFPIDEFAPRHAPEIRIEGLGCERARIGGAGRGVDGSRRGDGVAERIRTGLG